MAAWRRTKLLAELKACSISRNLERGKNVHEVAIGNADDSHIYVANTLINMYAKCGKMECARRIFDNMRHADVVSWNALILGYADNGDGLLALSLFSRMRSERLEPSARTFVASLKACKDLALSDQEVRRGEVLHLLALKSFCNSDIYIQGTLVDMYAKFGSMDLARVAFENMEHPDAVSWNALILGYAVNGNSTLALDMFVRMKREGCKPNARTFVSAIKACSELAEAVYSDPLFKETSIQMGKGLHILALRNGCTSDIYVQDTLIDMYSKCGNIEDAQRVFDRMEHVNVVSWTALMTGYAENGKGEVALNLFSGLAQKACTPNAITFVAALKSCADLAIKEEGHNQLETGKQIHLLASSCGCDSDVYVQDTLIDMYAKCRSMRHACKVFNMMEKPNVVSWTVLILGYAENGLCITALDAFSRMRWECCAPNSITFVAVLKASTGISRGEAIHLLASTSGCDSDSYVQDSLVDMYAKCENMTKSQGVFELVKRPSVVSWTTLILGYAENGDAAASLDMFLRMKGQSCAPNARTFVAMLKACCVLGSLASVKALHAEICNHGLDLDGILANSLVDVYAKCGSLSEAKKLFDSYGTKNLVTWNGLITGYCRVGDTRNVFDSFDGLCDAGLQPDRVTFLCLLTVCSHSGLVEKGKFYFEAMVSKYGVPADRQHYSCMVDILGRANQLDDAMVLLRSMPLSADSVTWMTVAGACWKWNLLELGKLAFESLIKLDEKNAAAYILRATREIRIT